jgi:hypothetical protein
MEEYHQAKQPVQLGVHADDFIKCKQSNKYYTKIRVGARGIIVG